VSSLDLRANKYINDICELLGRSDLMLKASASLSHRSIGSPECRRLFKPSALITMPVLDSFN